MREVMRGLRVMLAISFAADAWRSLAALVTASGRFVAPPVRAVGIALLVDGAVAHDHHGALVGAVVVVAATALVRAMDWASFNVRMRLRENTQLHLDARLMALVAGIPGIEHHERPEYLDKVELVRKERESLANPFNPIAWTVASLVQTACVVVILFRVHPILALVPLFGVPSIVASALGRRAFVDLHEKQAGARRQADHLLDLTTEAPPAKEVRIFGLGEELVARRRRAFAALETALVGVVVRATTWNAAGWTVFGAGYVAAVVFVVHLALTARATVGMVVLVLTVAGQLNQQLAELTGNVNWMVQTHRAIQRLLWLMDHATEARARLEPASPLPPPARLEQGIRLEGVSFLYPGTDKTVLEAVDLLLPAGATVAIVGENGAGKTTLVKLLCRLYEPTTGRILIDGVELGRIPIDAWRGRIAAGFQDFGKLHLRARESIGVGDVPSVAADMKIVAALERAAATELLATLPGGLDTQLGREFEGGVELSLGQWQKVALGRAMMRTEPLLVVLDEPTASLDAPTEHALFERFAGAARRTASATGAVTVLISHRFSTVRMADLILVVAGGRIAEAGDHATLVAAGGLYAELFELSRRGYR